MSPHIEVQVLNPAQLLLSLPDGKLLLFSIDLLTTYPFKPAYCVEELPTGWLSSGPDWATATGKVKDILTRFLPEAETDNIADSLLPFLQLLHPTEGKRITRWDLR